MINTPEVHRSYSSVYRDDDAKGTGCARSMLNSDFAWEAKSCTPRVGESGQWMQVELYGVTSLEGVVVQGRKNSKRRATTMVVQTSLHGPNGPCPTLL